MGVAWWHGKSAGGGSGVVEPGVRIEDAGFKQSEVEENVRVGSRLQQTPGFGQGGCPFRSAAEEPEQVCDVPKIVSNSAGLAEQTGGELVFLQGPGPVPTLAKVIGEAAPELCFETAVLEKHGAVQSLTENAYAAIVIGEFTEDGAGNRGGLNKLAAETGLAVERQGRVNEGLAFLGAIVLLA
jgi:hypothetical protein